MGILVLLALHFLSMCMLFSPIKCVINERHWDCSKSNRHLVNRLRIRSAHLLNDLLEQTKIKRSAIDV